MDLAQKRVWRATEAWGEDDGVWLQVPKFGAFGRRVMRGFGLKDHVRLRLDALSAAAWTRADGRLVAELLAELQAEFPKEPELPERLGAFLSMLVDKDLVRLE